MACHVVPVEYQINRICRVIYCPLLAHAHLARHAEDDRKFKELVDVKNQADHLIHSTEKMLKESEASVSADDKAKIEAALGELREATKSDDKAKIEAATKALSDASTALMAAAAAAAQAAQASAPGADAGSAQPKKDDGVVDAEFEEITDEDKKKK